MNSPVNIVDLALELPRRRRGRACIVLTETTAGRQAWADKLASKSGGIHLDLLDHFAKNTDLAAKAGMFGVDDLFDMLKSMHEETLLVVSGLEFLRAIWMARSGALETFAQRVEFWPDKPALIFVMQHETALAKRDFNKRFDGLFLVHQNDTLAI